MMSSSYLNDTSFSHNQVEYHDIKSDIYQSGNYWRTTISAVSHQSNKQQKNRSALLWSDLTSSINHHSSNPTHSLQPIRASHMKHHSNEERDNMISHAKVGEAVDNGDDNVRVVVISSTSIAKQKGNNYQMLSHPTKETIENSYSTGIPGAPVRNKRASYGLLARLSGLTLTGLSKNNNNDNGNADPQRLSNGSTSTSASSSRISLSRMFTSSKASDANPSSRSQSIPVQHESKFSSVKSIAEKRERRSLIPILPQPNTSQTTSMSSAKAIKEEIGVVAIVPTSAVGKNDKTKQEEIERIDTITNRVGDLGTAMYILSISKSILEMTIAGDKESKKIKSTKRMNENVMTNGNMQGTNQSITSMIAKTIGFGQVSSIPRSPLTAHKKVVSNPSNPQSSQSESSNSQSKKLSNSSKKRSSDSLTLRFYGIKQPKISLEKYICRVVRYLNSYYDHEPGLDSTSMKSVIVATLYIDRICETNPDFMVNSMNVHRLLLAGVVVANKIMEDDHPSNEFMAGVGGVELKELNALEINFCEGISFQLNVSFDEVAQLYNKYGSNHPHTLSEYISHKNI